MEPSLQNTTHDQFIENRRRIHAIPAQEVLQVFDVVLAQGLSSDEAKRRLQAYGPNQLHAVKPRSAWAILVDQFKSLVVLLLAAAKGMAITHGSAVGVVTATGLETELGRITDGEGNSISCDEGVLRRALEVSVLSNNAAIHRDEGTGEITAVGDPLEVALAAAVNAPLPILPLQILFLNLVTGVFPALALGLGEGDPTIMKRPPRAHEEPVIDRKGWLRVAGYGLL